MGKFQVWLLVGGCGPLIGGFAPVGGRGPETTEIELTSLSSNQAFTFTSLTWILSRKNSKTVQKFSVQHAEMQLLAVPLSVPIVFWKFEVRERLGQK